MKVRNSMLPDDFTLAVADIKLAILQSRARAARAANVEALKLYFYVGGYISKKTRSAKWGSGAIDALSGQLQVELPGLRGFSPSGIKRMRLMFEAWENSLEFRPLPLDEKSVGGVGEIRPLPMVELSDKEIAAFLSLGFTHHSIIIEKVKDINERWYYIDACAKEHSYSTESDPRISEKDAEPAVRHLKIK